MKERALKSLLVCALVALAPPAMADGRQPGSALIYPIQRSGPHFTIISVTNTNTDPANQFQLGGTTGIHWEYINVTPNPSNPLIPLACTVTDRVEFLTPGDTRSVLTTCHNGPMEEGFLCLAALDPNAFITPWSFNYLVGSELVVNKYGGMYSLNAVPFESPQPFQAPTDVDGDHQEDFDDIEYEGIPDDLYGEFVATMNSSLVLLNMSGGAQFVASVKFDVWNDNEIPLSASLMFKCWMERRLIDISPIFSDAFLRNTPNNPKELDVDCDEDDDFETGWFRLRGLNYSSPVETCVNPALLGAITAGPDLGPMFNGGHLLWESVERQFNGDCYNFSTDDPECPEDPNSPPNCVIEAPGGTTTDVGGTLTFDGSNSTDDDGAIVSFEWNFGDGDTDSGPVVMHQFDGFGNFLVTLFVTDDADRIRQCTIPVFVNAPPICIVEVESDGGFFNIGEDVCFDGSMSFDPDGGSIVQYDWDFGDGEQLVDGGPMVCHQYDTFGTFNVTLRVTDDEGSMNEDIADCSVTIVVNNPPMCDISGPSQANVGQQVVFDGSGSGDMGGTVERYDWNFGDGTVINDGNAMESHTYASGGTFTVTLTVTDDLNRVDTCFATIFVNALPVCNSISVMAADPQDFLVNNGGGMYTTEILVDLEFSANVSDPDDGGPFMFDWDFGDGNGSNQANPTHTYTAPGLYTVTLSVTDDEGRTTTMPCEVVIDVQGIAGFAAFIGSEIELHCPATVCSGLGRAMTRAVYENSRAAGDEILALGFDPNNQFNQQNIALDSWVGPDAQGGTVNVPGEGPMAIPGLNNVNITRVFTPAQFAAVSLYDYRMILVASYEGYIPNGINQALINAMNNRAAEFEEAVLRRGVGVLCLALAPAPDLVGMFTPPLIQNAFDWSPINFVTVRQTHRFVCPEDELTMGSPTNGTGMRPTGFPPIMPDTLVDSGLFCNPNQDGSLGHQDWENFFEPVGGDPDPFTGLIPLAEAAVQPPEVDTPGNWSMIGGIVTTQ